MSMIVGALEIRLAGETVRLQTTQLRDTYFSAIDRRMGNMPAQEAAD